MGRILKAGKPAVTTFRLDQRQRIVSQVGIATPISRDDVTGKVNVTAFGGTRFTAVWDTGAERTTVVPGVIENTQLKSHGFCKNRGVDGIVQTRPVYLASISMQTTGGVTFHSTEIVRLERDDQLGDVDVLIGMDIICRGDAAITADEQGGLWFSYRHPHGGKAIRFESPGTNPTRRH